MANLFARKPLAKLMAEAAEVGEHSLKRSLGPINLMALGIGGIIGAGLFVRTAAAIADRAGPSVVLAFIVAGIGCAFAGLCYAEFASMIPVAGSAYTYSYATMGEFVAWIIGGFRIGSAVAQIFVVGWRARDRIIFDSIFSWQRRAGDFEGINERNAFQNAVAGIEREILVSDDFGLVHLDVAEGTLEFADEISQSGK